MTENKKDFVYKEQDKGHKELFSMLFYRPLAKVMVLKIFKGVDISPNYISLMSLFLAIVASAAFAFLSYPAIIIGVLFLHLSYLFDVLDGQYARYKGFVSKFGKWFDPFVDIIKASFVVLSLTYSAFYTSEGNCIAFVYGFMALTNSFLAFYVLNTRIQIIKDHVFEVRPMRGIYIGYEISFYWAISLFVLIDKIYFGLLFLATIGAAAWIKPFITLKRYYYKHKSELG